MFKRKIICAPMNGVSNFNLAMACAASGIIPSMIAIKISNEQLEQAAKKIKSNIDEWLITCPLKTIALRKDIFKSIKLPYLEILDFQDEDLTEENYKCLTEIRSAGVKILLKIIHPDEITSYFTDIIDAVVVKGSDAAGRSAENVNLLELVKEIKTSYPALCIVASGGIKNKQDIDELINAGADAVSVGTLFALSEESSMPTDVKLKLISKSSSDIQRLSTGANQRGIIFSSTEETDYNNTAGLKLGLQTGTDGHVYIGNAIDSVTKIETVNEIANRLLG